MQADVGVGKGNTAQSVQKKLSTNNQSTSKSNVQRNSTYYGTAAPKTVQRVAPRAVAPAAPKPVAPVAAKPVAPAQPVVAPKPIAPVPTQPAAPPVVPPGYLTEDQVNEMLLEQNKGFEQKLAEQGSTMDGYFGNLTDMLAGGMMGGGMGEQGMGEYETMFKDLQAQYAKMQEQIQYFQVLQQYWNMYGGQGNGKQNSPFM